MKWTEPEVDKLKLLAKKGLAHDEIAKVCLSSVGRESPPERAFSPGV